MSQNRSDSAEHANATLRLLQLVQQITFENSLLIESTGKFLIKLLKILELLIETILLLKIVF